MNKLLILSILCVACAALKSLLAVLIVGLALTLIWGLLTKPWQALGLLFSLAMATLWTAYPLGCLISLALAAILGLCLMLRDMSPKAKRLAR